MTFLSMIDEDLDEVLEARAAKPVTETREVVKGPEYNPVVYAQQKENGERNEKGVMNLKELSPHHFRVINCWLEGNSPKQTAEICECTAASVWRIVNDPLAAPFLAEAYKSGQSEIDAMLGKNIDVIRDILEKGTDKDKLGAVNTYAKLKTVVASETNPEESAEDLAAKIVAKAVASGVVRDINIQVNQGLKGA